MASQAFSLLDNIVATNSYLECGETELRDPSRGLQTHLVLEPDRNGSRGRGDTGRPRSRSDRANTIAITLRLLGSTISPFNHPPRSADRRQCWASLARGMRRVTITRLPIGSGRISEFATSFDSNVSTVFDREPFIPVMPHTPSPFPPLPPSPPPCAGTSGRALDHGYPMSSRFSLDSSTRMLVNSSSIP